MSIHYSKFELCTYCGTPYFQAHLPEDYPLHLVMQECRAHRRLPPNLRHLCALARKWAARKFGMSASELSQGLYSNDAYELDPDTGNHLTDKEVNAEWDSPKPGIKVEDIPIPEGGFPDPDTWEEPPHEPVVVDRSEIDEKGVLDTITTFGRTGAARMFGVPTSWLAGIHTDGDLVKAAMGMHGKPWPARDEVELSIRDGDTKTAEKPQVKIGVHCDWDDLKSVVVGRIDHDVFAPRPWQPSVSGLPKEGGVSYKDFAPDQWNTAVQQLDNLTSILEREGVDVRRPSLVSLEEALAVPVGLTQVYVREGFTIINDTVVLGQCRTPYRRKESRALEPMFDGCKMLRLPPAPDDISDSEPDDPNPYIEGGDIFRLGKDVIITMSGLATSPSGFRFVADYLEQEGIEAWPAQLLPEFEHGDYVLMLVREGLCVAYVKGFVDGILPTPIADWDVIHVTKAEADPGMCCNGIVLRKNVVVLPAGCNRVVRALERKGVDVIEVPFDGVNYFQGSIDCSTAELLREEPSSAD